MGTGSVSEGLGGFQAFELSGASGSDFGVRAGKLQRLLQTTAGPLLAQGA